MDLQGPDLPMVQSLHTQDITIAPYIVPEHFGTTVTVSKTRPSVACNATEHTLHNTLLSDKQCSLPHTKVLMESTSHNDNVNNNIIYAMCLIMLYIR